MFLQDLEELCGFDPDPSAGVLDIMPLAERRKLCATTIQSCVDGTTEPTSFKTVSQIAWIAEILGYAFKLPFDHMDDIDSAFGSLEVYKRWLGLPAPDPLELDKTSSTERKTSSGSQDRRVSCPLDPAYCSPYLHVFYLLTLPLLTLWWLDLQHTCRTYTELCQQAFRRCAPPQQ